MSIFLNVELSFSVDEMGSWPIEVIDNRHHTLRNRIQQVNEHIEQLESETKRLMQQTLDPNVKRNKELHSSICDRFISMDMRLNGLKTERTHLISEMMHTRGALLRKFVF